MARAKLREIAQQSDPKQAILDSLGSAIDRVYPLRYEVIVATYIRPEKTPGGIYLSDKALAEDRFQGKVGLLVKVGCLTFDEKDWGIDKPKLHDWVYYNASDGIEMFIRDERGDGTSVRRMDDISIRGIVEDPFLIW